MTAISFPSSEKFSNFDDWFFESIRYGVDFPKASQVHKRDRHNVACPVEYIGFHELADYLRKKGFNSAGEISEVIAEICYKTSKEMISLAKNAFDDKNLILHFDYYCRDDSNPVKNRFFKWFDDGIKKSIESFKKKNIDHVEIFFVSGETNPRRWTPDTINCLREACIELENDISIDCISSQFMTVDNKTYTNNPIFRNKKDTYHEKNYFNQLLNFFVTASTPLNSITMINVPYRLQMHGVFNGYELRASSYHMPLNTPVSVGEFNTLLLPRIPVIISAKLEKNHSEMCQFARTWFDSSVDRIIEKISCSPGESVRDKLRLLLEENYKLLLQSIAKDMHSIEKPIISIKETPCCSRFKQSEVDVFNDIEYIMNEISLKGSMVDIDECVLLENEYVKKIKNIYLIESKKFKKMIKGDFENPLWFSQTIGEALRDCSKTINAK